MGAPGRAYLCARGHLYCWIEDDLYWGSWDVDEDEMLIFIPYEPLWEKARRAREGGCPCGEKVVYEFLHYGGLNDLICRHGEEETAGILYLGEEILPNGIRLPCYDLSRVDPEILRQYRVS